MESRNDLPWSIPIRDASDDIPRRSARRFTGLPVTPAAIGVVLVAAIAFYIWHRVRGLKKHG